MSMSIATRPAKGARWPRTSATPWFESERRTPSRVAGHDERDAAGPRRRPGPAVADALAGRHVGDARDAAAQRQHRLQRDARG